MAEFQISFAAARVNAGMTQENVAKAMRISKQTIVNWEKGISEPSITHGRELSELYNLHMDYIFLPKKSNLNGFKRLFQVRGGWGKNHISFIA